MNTPRRSSFLTALAIEVTSPLPSYFLRLITRSMEQLVATLKKRRRRYVYYLQICKEAFSLDSNEKILDVYDLLIQASFFNSQGITVEELGAMLRISRNIQDISIPFRFISPGTNRKPSLLDSSTSVDDSLSNLVLFTPPPNLSTHARKKLFRTQIFIFLLVPLIRQVRKLSCKFIMPCNKLAIGANRASRSICPRFHRRFPSMPLTTKIQPIDRLLSQGTVCGAWGRLSAVSHSTSR